ncbi:MAG: hypothetical protein KDA41_07440 [Planctomycetales bacterium]|nr:hypothetical protein [Planctomycetales bacterium]
MRRITVTLRWTSLAILLGAAFAVALRSDRGASAVAQDKPAKRSSPDGRTPMGLTVAREAAAMAFVRAHHPDLEQLLVQLKEVQPKQYEEAVRDLFRTSERMATLAERDLPRHDAELAVWRSRSRVQLLSAQLLMSPQDVRVRARLKESIIEHLAARRASLELQRERMARNLANLDASLDKMSGDVDKTAEKQIRALLENAATGGPVSKTKPPKETSTLGASP